MSHDPGLPAWADLSTTDLPGAVDYYSNLFGWTPVEAIEPEAVEALPSFWMRMFLQTAPLLLPALSCVLALLAFLWLDEAVAFLITALLAVVGVVGIVRRIQLATFWMIGLVIAGLLVRFS